MFKIYVRRHIKVYKDHTVLVRDIFILNVWKVFSEPLNTPYLEIAEAKYKISQKRVPAHLNLNLKYSTDDFQM